MAQIDYKATYVEAVRKLTASLDRDQAMNLAVGGQFASFGALTREILISAGLRPDHYLIDVGCGSGRLAVALKTYLTGRYFGIDVVPDLLQYARAACGRPDWRFEEADGTRIPEADDTADMVCFFSVLTHLQHEDSFLYLTDAARVLKCGGLIVFSFLDFSIPSHWDVFNGMLDSRVRGETTHHNQFMAREMIHPWAERLGLEPVAILDGNKPQVHLTFDIALDDGSLLPRAASLGQSVCILRKASTTAGHSPRSEATRSQSPTQDVNGVAVQQQAQRIASLEQRLASLGQRLTLREAKLDWLELELGPLLHSRTWAKLCRAAAWLHKTFRTPRNEP
jgi:SAM-dependent methyltransferase